MEFLSLFTGIGGLDIGLDANGFKAAAQVEIDQPCLNILNRHWPDVPKITDVRDVHGADFKKIGLICGGFPCTDISAAKDRWGAKGVQGDESGLWFEFARIIEEAEPKWVVVENTGRLRNGRGGSDLRAVVGELARLSYVGIAGVYDTAAFGLSARRPRVVLIARRARNARGISEGQRLAECAYRNDPGFFLLEGAGQPLATDYGSLRPTPGNYRMLTPEETEEALGFPDGWTSGQSKTQRYKQTGNAFSPKLATWVGKVIQEARHGPDED